MDEIDLPVSDLNLLSQDILSRPAYAALPSQLPDYWLRLIARDLEETVGDGSTKASTAAAAPLALIIHILSSRVEGGSLNVSLQDMYGYFCDLRIEISLEMIRRFTAIEIEPATLDTIFLDRTIVLKGK